MNEGGWLPSLVNSGENLKKDGSSRTAARCFHPIGILSNAYRITYSCGALGLGGRTPPLSRSNLEFTSNKTNTPSKSRAALKGEENPRYPSKMLNILDLPPEILSDICCTLCPHCPGPELKDTDLECPPFKTARDSLSALSLTCRAFRDAAQPILYHCPDFQKQLFKFLCILFRNPTLARSVKVMRVVHKKAPNHYTAAIGGYRIWPSDAKILCNTLYEAIAAGEEPESPLRAHSRDEASAKANLELAMAALMLTKTSNVETLSMNVINGWPFNLYTEDSLPKLVRLEVDSRNPFGLDDLMDIFSDAAPQLRELSVRGVNKTSQLRKHAQLRKLRVRGCMLGKDDLMAVAKAFEGLECLDYEHQKPHSSNVTPPYLQDLADVFLERKDTLKELIFSVERNAGIRSETASQFSLKGMQVLETLTWETWDIWHDLNGGLLEQKEDRDYLTRLLPTSIKTLTLNLPWLDFKEAIEVLGEVAPIQFPSLKKVIFRFSRDDEERMLKGCFNPVGISVTYRRNFAHFRGR